MVKAEREWLRITGPQCDVTGNDDDRHALPGDGRAHGDSKHARHLFGLRDQFAVVAAILEQVLRVSLLEITAADFGTGNLRGDRQYGHAGAMTVIKSVDKVQIPRTTTAGAHGELSGDLGVGSCGEGRRFFMPHVQPVNPSALSHGVRQTVERVAHDAVDTPDSGLD